MTQAAKAPSRSLMNRFLNFVEWSGNLLPHPATLFIILAAFVVLMSWVASSLGWSAAHPASGEMIQPVNLLSIDGIHRMLTGAVTNFTSFAPLGTVLVALIGIGVAEHSGLIGASLRMLVLAAPKFLLTPIIVFAGVMSNMASEIGYVLLVPLAGLIFQAAGRHPILGMAAGFAGVSGGYSANLLIGTIDPLLSGLSQEAARIIDPNYTVSPLANWYFMIASTPLISLLGWYVTEKIIAPRFRIEGEPEQPSFRAMFMMIWKQVAIITAAALLLVYAFVQFESIPSSGFAAGLIDLFKRYWLIISLIVIIAGNIWTYISYRKRIATISLNQVDNTNGDSDIDPNAPPASVESQALNLEELRGMLYSITSINLFTLLLLWGIADMNNLIPASGWLRDPGTGELLKSPFLSGIVAIIFLYGVIAGIAYGFGAKTMRNDADVINAMGKSMSTLGGYLVLVFFAAQFVAFFNWTQLGLIFAVEGADFLRSLNLPTIPLFICFILLAAFVNLFMGSASAKWALMAPIFIPMFMLLGYSPEMTQVAYRVGDSVTNIIAPMMSYFALIIAFFQKYEPKAGIGTIVATMLPYSMIFLAGWSIMFGVWIWLELPIGPDSPLTYIPAVA